MSQSIPDLWPEKINVDGLPPLVILKAQAAKLADKTLGILEAEVVTDDTDAMGPGGKLHTLELIAPALDNYRHSVLQLIHREPLVYPVQVKSEGSSKPVQNQSDLLDAIGQALRSPRMLGVIDSLIARSNEATGRLDPVTTD